MVLAFHPSQAETATGNSVANPSSNGEVIAMFVNVTAASGTAPTIVVKIQDSADGTNFADVPSLTTSTITGTGLVRIAVPTVGLKLSDFARAVWTIGGTGPSFTFTVSITVK